jgi:hypothetical protein
MLGPPTMFASGPATPPPQDGYIQPNLSHGLRIWWAYWWPTFLLSVLATFFTNLVVRRISDDPRVPGWLPGPILRFDSYFFTYFFGYFMLALVLRKDFRRFRIGLLSNQGGPGAETLPPNIRRTARVWWTFTWRSLVYRIIVAVAVSFPLSWIVGFLTALFRDVPVLPGLIMFLFGVAVEAAVGLFVIYSNILDEDISDFRVALLPPSVPAPVFSNSAPPADIPAS